VDPWRGAWLLPAGAVFAGLGSLLLGIEAFADGRTVVGWVVTVLAVLGIACGAAGLLVARKAERFRRDRGEGV
jgi:hypothetical protein